MIKMITTNQALSFMEIPIDIYKLILKNDCICYGDVIDNKVISIAVFTASALQKSDIILRYIGVDKSMRFPGHADNLLNYCKEELVRNKIRGIYIKLNEDRYEICGHNEFLVSHRFIPVCTSGHSLEYTVNMLKEAPAVIKVLDNISHFPQTETIGDWGTAGLRQFLNRNKDSGLFLSKDSHDPRYSRIYRHEELIKAAMFVGEYDKEYIVSKIYIEDDVHAEVIIPSLIVGLISNMGNTDRKIKIQVFKPNVYNGVHALLGTPIIERNIFEYYLILGNR